MVDYRNATRPQDSREFGEIIFGFSSLNVDEYIIRPHNIDRFIGNATQCGAVIHEIVYVIVRFEKISAVFNT